MWLKRGEIWVARSAYMHRKIDEHVGVGVTSPGEATKDRVNLVSNLFKSWRFNKSQRTVYSCGRAFVAENLSLSYSIVRRFYIRLSVWV